MKRIIFITSILFLSLQVFSQSTDSKRLPPMKDLPKKGEKKVFYELPKDTDYKVFDQKGKLYSEGKGYFVDMTKCKKGKTYFIVYDEKKIAYNIEK